MFRSRWAAIGAAVAVTLGAGGLVGVSASSQSGATLTPITPVRILDTRSGDPVGSLDVAGNGTPYRLKVAGAPGSGIPAQGVTGVSLNVTAVSTQANDYGGFLTVYPCESASSSRPNVSNLNFVSGQTLANSVVVPVSDSGHICFYVYGMAHLLADANGYYSSGPAASIVDLSDYYAKSEVDNIVATLATSDDLSDFYTSDVTDELLESYATSNDLSLLRSDTAAKATAAELAEKLELLTYSGNLSSAIFSPGRYPDIGVTPDGLPVVSLQHHGVADIYLAACLSEGCINGVVAENVITGFGASFSSVGISASGFPLVAHFSDNTILELAVCGDRYCSPASRTNVEIDDEASTYVSMAVPPDGRPVLTYLAHNPVAGTASIRVARCIDTVCGGVQVSDIYTRDYAYPSPGFPKIAIKGDGNPVLSFYVPSVSPTIPGDVWLVGCTDARCVGDLEWLAYEDGSGSHALTTSADGNPLLVYYTLDQVTLNDTGSELILLACEDLLCDESTRTTLTAGLTPSSLQQRPSIIVRESGFPLVAYFDTNFEAIAIVDCNDQLCSGGDETHRIIDSSERGNTSMTLGPHGYPVLAYDGPAGTNNVTVSILAIE